MVSTSKSPVPPLVQRTPSSGFQARAALSTVILSATMKPGKAHAELADELGVRLLVAGEAAHELLGAALGDGAQMVDGLLLAHADAVVGDGQVLAALSKLTRTSRLGASSNSAALFSPQSAACRRRPTRWRSARGRFPGWNTAKWVTRCSNWATSTGTTGVCLLMGGSLSLGNSGWNHTKGAQKKSRVPARQA